MSNKEIIPCDDCEIYKGHIACDDCELSDKQIQTMTKKKYKLIKQFSGGHLFFQENVTGLLVMADQSCINREAQANPEWADHEILYVICTPLLTQLYKYIKASEALKGCVKKITSVTYPVFPNHNGLDERYMTSLTPKEVKWLYNYYNDQIK